MSGREAGYASSAASEKQLTSRTTIRRKNRQGDICPLQRTYCTMNPLIKSSRLSSSESEEVVTPEPVNLGPVFTAVRRQLHPSRWVHDLGLQMRWGAPPQTARLYRNCWDCIPYTFNFNHVVIHEDDALYDFSCQEHQARQTAVGMFYPLTAYLVELYRRGQADRDLFSALAEVDRALPADRRSTLEDTMHMVRTLGKGKSLPAPPPPPDPATGLLVPKAEERGFRLTEWLSEGGALMLNIAWLPRPGGRLFFTGILELHVTRSGFHGRWRPPGPCGVNELLRTEFDQKCDSLGDCLTPKGLVQCVTESTTDAR